MTTSSELQNEVANATFPPEQAHLVPAFTPGHPNKGPTLKNPIMGAAPYNGQTGPASKKNK
jgi:hypothetical protein